MGPGGSHPNCRRPVEETRPSLRKDGAQSRTAGPGPEGDGLERPLGHGPGLLDLCGLQVECLNTTAEVDGEEESRERGLDHSFKNGQGPC